MDLWELLVASAWNMLLWPLVSYVKKKGYCFLIVVAKGSSLFSSCSISSRSHAACVYQLINTKNYLFGSKGTFLQSGFPSSCSFKVAEISVQFNGITKSCCVFRFLDLGIITLYVCYAVYTVQLTMLNTLFFTWILSYIGCAEYIWIPTFKWWRGRRQ